MSIINLLNEYQNNKLPRRDFEKTLTQYQQLCEQQLTQLNRLGVPQEDQTVWNEELKPGLEACYKALISASSESLAYGVSRDESCIPAILGLLQEVERATIFLDSRAAQVSGVTRELLNQSLAMQGDGFNVRKAMQGVARANLELMDEAR